MLYMIHEELNYSFKATLIIIIKWVIARTTLKLYTF